MEGKTTETKPEDRKNGKTKRWKKTNKGSSKPPKGNEELFNKVKQTLQDYTWYDRYHELMQKATRLAWSYIAGDKLEDLRGFSRPSAGMIINYVPTPGKSTEFDSAINTLGRATWLDMHRRYRGLGGYQQSDLSIILFCIMEAFADIANAERVYGVLNYYNLMNRNTPETLLQMLHLDVSKVYTADDIANFRDRLNFLIKKAKVLCLPTGINYVAREITMRSLIFKDSESSRACFVAFNTDGYWKYEPALFNTGSAAQFKLKSTDASSTAPYNRTLETIINDLNDQINILLSDDDVQRVCSDLIAAYVKSREGNVSNVMQLQLLDENFVITPIYDEMWLKQIHNSTSVVPEKSHTFNRTQNIIQTGYYTAGLVGTGDGCYLHQDNDNVIQFRPCVTNASGTETVGAYTYPVASYASSHQESVNSIPSSAYGLILNTDKEMPDHEEIVEISRLTAFVTPQINTAGTAAILDIDEYCTDIVVDYILFNDPARPMGGTPLCFGSFIGMMLQWKVPNEIAQVKWHPILYARQYDYSISPTIDVVCAELDNPVSLHRHDFVTINNVSKLSLLGNPLADEVLK